MPELLERPADVADRSRPRPPRRVVTRRHVRLAAAAIALALLATLASLVHRVLDNARGTPLQTLRAADDVVIPTLVDDRFPALVGLLTGARLEPGHTVEVLTEAEQSFDRLFGDLRAAQSSIALQPYYCQPGRVADTAVAILTERARAGVRVRVLADGYGCRRFAQHYGGPLRDAGVELAVLRPVHWYTLHRAQHRAHLRIVVVDDSIAYTGGFGIDDKWLYARGEAAAWRETNVRFTGPAVRAAAAAFTIGWAEATRALVIDRGVLGDSGARNAAAAAAPAVGVVAGLQVAGPALGSTPFERLLFLTAGAARERLWIANPYFLPNRAQRRLLADAAARGVDVRVLTAGAQTDVRSTRLASRASYGSLLAAGVRIYEYRPGMMHAKTMVGDGVWTVIGSMNFDNRSFRLADEANLLVHDAAVARGMERVFEDDLAHAQEVTARAHASRPWYQRLLERVFTVVEPLL
jgi:cardiolipin synthase A/B